MKHQLLLAFLILWSITVFPQTRQDHIKQQILHNDSLFWNAYNNCDIGGMQVFIADDLEFYHDKGGITKGLDQFLSTTKRNLCSNENFHLRREAVDSTVQVYLLNNGDTSYGAILSGEHVFYVLEQGKKERLDGLAKFTHLWILKDSVWKMSRVLSYDHGPAPYISKRRTVAVSQEILRQYAGNYKGLQTGGMAITADQGTLRLSIGGRTVILYPESSNRFFSKERDLLFEFIKNVSGQVTEMIVRENGEVVETAQAVR